MMGSDTLIKIAIELTQKMKETTSKVDWNLKDSIRAQMRIEIRQLLRKYDYPPSGHEQSINLIMEQT